MRDYKASISGQSKTFTICLALQNNWMCCQVLSDQMHFLPFPIDENLYKWELRLQMQ